MKKKAYRLPILSFMITPIDSQFVTATWQRFYVLQQKQLTVKFEVRIPS